MIDPFNQNYKAPLLLTECPVCEKLIPLNKGAFEKHCAEVNDNAHVLYEVMES
jgi:hypothetical protein